MTDRLATCLGAIHDDATLLAPRGVTVEASFAEQGERLVLRGLGYDAQPTSSSTPIESDHDIRMQDLANAATNLRAAIAERGTRWDGARRLTVSPGRGDVESVVTLFSGARNVASLEVRASDGCALVTAAMVRLFDRLAPELAQLRERSERIAQQFRGASIDKSNNTLRLELATPMVFPLDFLGAYSRPQYTLVWGWHGPGGDLPDRTHAREVRDRMQRAGVTGFCQPNVWADPSFARALAQAAAVMCGATALFSADDGTTVRFFALA